MGAAGFPATEQFLRRTLVPRFDHANLVNSRQIWPRRSVYLRDVWRWWGVRAEEQERAGDATEAWDTHRENLHLLAQYRAGDTSQEHDRVANACRAATTELLLSLVQNLDFRLLKNVAASQGWPSVSLFVLVQWSLYHGPYLTVALWASLVTLVTLVRSRADLGRRFFSRTRWRCLPRAFAKPAIAAAVFFLAVYLAMVPRIISVSEADFQENIAFARNPEGHWAEVRQTVAAIRAEQAATKTKAPD